MPEEITWKQAAVMTRHTNEELQKCIKGVNFQLTGMLDNHREDPRAANQALKDFGLGNAKEIQIAINILDSLGRFSSRVVQEAIDNAT